MITLKTNRQACDYGHRSQIRIEEEQRVHMRGDGQFNCFYPYKVENLPVDFS